MKTKFLYMVILAISTLIFGSCGDDSTEGLTRITYYPTIVLKGNASLVVAKGSEYVDPGYTSTMNGEDVSNLVTVSGTVNTSKSGVYTLTYTTTKNEDGFNATKSRTVIVLNTSDPIEGVYLVDKSKSYRVSSGVTTPYGNYNILVFGNGDGTYSVDDLLGGYYYYYKGYGINYAMAGNISVDSDGKMTVLNSNLPGFGGSCGLTGTYDSDAKAFNFTSVYSGMTFVVSMTKE